MTNDCRLCVPAREKDIWNSCRTSCSKVPNDLKHMKIFMKIAFQKTVSIESKWNMWLSKNRNSTSELFPDNQALFSFFKDMNNDYE